MKWLRICYGLKNIPGIIKCYQTVMKIKALSISQEHLSLQQEYIHTNNNNDNNKNPNNHYTFPVMKMIFYTSVMIMVIPNGKYLAYTRHGSISGILHILSHLVPERI